MKITGTFRSNRNYPSRQYKCQCDVCRCRQNVLGDDPKEGKLCPACERGSHSEALR